MEGAKPTVPMLAALLAMPACERAPQPPRVTVEHSVVTLPAVPGRPGAAYFTLRTNHDRTRLTGLASPQAERIELHETVRQGGVGRMAALGEASFGPGAPLVFAPGGRHAMLFGLDPRLRAAGRITLTFRFEPAPPVTVEAEVRAPGDAGHSGH